MDHPLTKQVRACSCCMPPRSTLAPHLTHSNRCCVHQLVFDIMGREFQRFAFPKEPWEPHTTHPPFVSAAERRHEEKTITADRECGGGRCLSSVRLPIASSQ